MSDPRTKDISGAMVSVVYIVEAGPSTYKSVKESDEACEWQDVIDSECVSLEKHRGLTFFDKLPDTTTSIPPKLILQRKLNPAKQAIRLHLQATVSTLSFPITKHSQLLKVLLLSVTSFPDVLAAIVQQDL